MSAEQTFQINPLLRRFDNILAEPAFNELLELAVDTCLTSTGRFDKALRQIEQTSPESQLSDEAVLVRRLGLWGVRTAQEIVALPDHFTYNVPEEPLDNEEAQARYDNLLQPDAPLKTPELFSSAMDIRIAHKIEALGKAVMDEAFICLGEDAWDKVQAWREAKTLEEKEAILQWLTKRVHSIGREKNDSDAESETEDEVPNPDDYFYHPMRLSPRLMGQFPDINLEPTCLARSILQAAFLEKAGTPYLHTGVAESNADSARNDLNLVLYQVGKLAEEWQVEIPDVITQRLNIAREELGKLLYADNGFHAAILQEVTEDAWGLTDVNFGVNVIMDPDRSKNCIEAYQQLQQLHDIAPGTERMVVDNYGLFGYLPLFVLEQSKEKSLQLEEIDDYLQNCDDYSSLLSLSKRFIEPLFIDNEDKNLAKIGDYSIKTLSKLFDMSPDDYWYSIAEDVILQYVFNDGKDGDIQTCLARCKTDGEYRARRAEDLKLAPLYAAVIMATQAADGVLDRTFVVPHQILEAGMPRYRIGAAVLSDFAVYCGDDLPLSFWLTYWPSHASLTEHMHSATETHQRSFVHNHTVLSGFNSLQYMKNHDIIAEFLKQEQESEQESTQERGATDDDE